MGKDAAADPQVRSIIDAALRGELTEAMARRMYALGQEARGTSTCWAWYTWHR